MLSRTFGEICVQGILTVNIHINREGLNNATILAIRKNKCLQKSCETVYFI